MIQNIIIYFVYITTNKSKKSSICYNLHNISILKNTLFEQNIRIIVDIILKISEYYYLLILILYLY